MAPVRLLSTLALSGVLDALLPQLAAGLPPVELQLVPTNVLLDRIAAGTRGDIAILTDAAVDDLSASGTLDGASRDRARMHNRVTTSLVFVWVPEAMPGMIQGQLQGTPPCLCLPTRRKAALSRCPAG